MLYSVQCAEMPPAFLHSYNTCVKFNTSAGLNSINEAMLSLRPADGIFWIYLQAQCFKHKVYPCPCCFENRTSRIGLTSDSLRNKFRVILGVSF